MRKPAFLMAAAAVVIAVPTFAQSINDPASVRNTTAPPAVSNPNDTAKTSAAPVAGKNSFTEGQVVKRLQEQGYTNVTGLTKDSQAIWRATATLGGAPVDVAVDYQGNVTQGNVTAR